MNLDWTADDIEYRRELKAFLLEALGPDWKGYGHLSSADYKAASVAFCQKMAERGYLTQNWPREYGGAEASPWRAAILSEELSVYEGDPRGSQYMNVNWIGPAMMQFGSEAQKAFFLPKISAGEITFSQGFSEPEAGSDLASLRTQAVRDGDEYVVNGEKIWTSHTSIAEWLFLLVRTDPSERRSKGITVLLVPMNTPGLKVNKVAGFVGESAFSNPVFTDMRVPVANRLGAENAGWAVVRWALAFERIGVAHYRRAATLLDRTVREIEARGLMGDPAIQAKVGEAWEAVEAARLLFFRVVDLRAQGSPPTADSNLARVAGTRAYQIVAETAELALAEYGLEGAGRSRFTLTSGVASGTTEVQLDQIATRFLNLPRPAVGAE
ncbi:MAG: acyl-CoA dehydrogenase family protein [Caulobacteraceae bacterium]|nr:acyl-CoA dehydrogenase family protein [Caulobacteraceae bacterium]